MKRLGAMIAVAAVLAAWVAATQAGPLQQERVSATAKWVVHVDVEGLLATDLAGMLLKQEKVAADVAKGVKKFVDEAGCDPTKDIKAVTAYGTTFEKEHGVVIIQAKFDREKVLAKVTKADDHKETTYGDVTIHQWTQKHGMGNASTSVRLSLGGTAKVSTGESPAAAPEVKDADHPKPKAHDGKGKTLYGCFYLKDLVLLASDMDSIKLALDVLDGKKDNLTKSDLAALLPKDKSVVVAAARDIELPKDEKHVPAMLRSLDSASFSCGESDGKASVTVSVVCRDAKDAGNLRNFVSGMLALISMPGVQDENQPAECAELLKGVAVGGEDKTVTLSGKWDVAVLKKLLATWQGAKAKVVAPPAANP